jgi:methanogenic corrinoid protein MtbC1
LAIDAVAERFDTDHRAVFAQYDQRDREACREDLAFHLDFLRPVLEFGLVQPMVDYLRWLAGVLEARDIPVEQLPQSLEWLAEFFAGAMDDPDGIAIAAALRNVKARFLQPHEAAPATYAMMPTAWPECEAFQDALLAGDRRRAGALLDGCFAQGRSLVDAEMHMIQPALYGIGQKWQNNEVSVAQEHLATAISQSLMTGGLLRSEIPPANGSKVVLACVEGNFHAVGLQMVADAFQLAGWEVQFLGGNVPTSALLQLVAAFKPNLIGLSVSFAQQLRVVREIMLRLTETFGAERPPVIIGGLAINQFRRIADTLGADGWGPDARSALVSGSALATQSAPG